MMETRLPQKLRLLRVRQGLTLVQAAEKTGVTRATLSDLERGNRHPVATTLVKIAEGYGIPVEELLEQEQPLSSGKAEASPSSESINETDEERREDLRDTQKLFLEAHDLLEELAKRYGDDGDGEKFDQLVSLAVLATYGAANELEEEVESKDYPEVADVYRAYLGLDGLVDRLVNEHSQKEEEESVRRRRENMRRRTAEIAKTA
jgi:transcriptional regulator with XRE-family HTH domain